MDELRIQKILYWITIVGIGLAAIGFVLHCQYFWSFTVDDGAISFTFARNLADGYGLVYFPDGERVEGYSNPIWMFFLALLIKIGITPFISAKVFGALFGAGAIILLAMMVPRCFGGRLSPASLVAACLLAANTSFACYVVSGLENGLYMFLLALSLFLHLREMPDRSRFPWSGLAMLALALTRPEAILAVAILAFHRGMDWIIKRRLPDKQDLQTLALFIVPFGIYQAWHYQYFRDFLPNTYYAKMKQSEIADVAELNSGGWIYVKGFLSSYHISLLAPLIAAGLILPGPWIPRLLITAFIIAGGFFPIYSRGDWMREYRLLTMFSGFLFLLAAGGAQLLFYAAWKFTWKKKDNSKTSRAQKDLLAAAPKWRFSAGIALLLVSIGLSAPTGLAAVENSPKFKSRPTATYKNISKRAKRFHNAAELAHVLPWATLTDPDMGGVGWDWGGRILDLGRLCDVAFARYHYDQHFVQERVLDEEHVEFAHIRRWVKNKTRLPFLKRWQDEYIVLPKKGETVEQHGDYVKKKGVFILETPSDVQPISEPIGDFKLQLVQLEPQSNILPSEGMLSVKKIWTVSEKMPEGIRFELLLTNSSDKDMWSSGKLEPVYGWYTSEMWLPGEYVFEWLDAELRYVPEGEYHYAIRVHYMGEILGRRDLPITLVISDKKAKQFQQEKLALAKTKLNQEPEFAWEAYQSALHAGAKENLKLEKKMKKARIEALTVASKSAADRKDDKTAEKLAIKARKIDPTNCRIRKYVHKLAMPFYQKGRELEKGQEWGDAFESYKKALYIDPQLAAARMHAEKIRKFRWR